MQYVDGYVLAVPTENLANYRKVATKAGKIWREHGALEYWECAGDNMDVKFGRSFPKTIKSKPTETVVFAWVVFESRKQRDKVNAKVMADPRLAAMCEESGMQFDAERMTYGGFKPMVKF